MKFRKSRQYKRGRIEIIPMIDVMFFLLVTFMLASLSMQNLHSMAVNLPQGHAALMQPKDPVTLTVTRDSRILLDKTPVTLETLAPTLKTMLKGTDSNVIVAADQERDARRDCRGDAASPPGGGAALPDSRQTC